MPQVANIKTRAIQGESLSAAHDRLANITLNEGVLNRAGNSFLVTQDTGSNMNIQVGSDTAFDRCVIESDEPGGGTYILEHQDAQVILTVTTADATNPRIDLVVARVYDNVFDASGNEYGDVEIIAGTPAGSPVAPTLPDGAIPLASISVPASDTSISNAQITDLRVQAEAAPELSNGAWSLVYPVGSVYISVVATNPSTLFGGGTWVAFSTGRVLVGQQAGDPDFDTAEETGGAKTHTHALTHTHQIDPPATTSTTENTGFALHDSTDAVNFAVENHTHSVNIAAFTSGGASASSGSATSVQPYIVVYMWKRTA